MKKYMYFLTLWSLLCWTACANKNVASETTQDLSDTSHTTVEGYDVTAAVTSICACLEEQAKQQGLNDKQPTPTSINVAKYQGNCDDGSRYHPRSRIK